MIFWELCISVLCCMASTKGTAVKDNTLHNPDDPFKCLHKVYCMWAGPCLFCSSTAHYGKTPLEVMSIVRLGRGEQVALLILTSKPGPKQWQFPSSNPGERSHHYFYSRDIPEFKDYKYDWLTARNLCRNHCMDAVAIETEAENNMMFDFIKNHDIYEHVGPTWYDNGQCGSSFPFKDGTISQCDSISDTSCCGRDGFCVSKEDLSCNCPECIDYSRSIDYLWTSGRLCDFTGCEDRQDLIPLNVKGWFWSNNLESIPDTNQTSWSHQPWSPTGHTNIPQPDDAEYFINQKTEACLGILNNLYDDGVKWHDIACYHEKPVLCEDDENLLGYMQNEYPQYNFY